MWNTFRAPEGPRGKIWKKNPTQHDFKRNKSHVSKPVLLTDFLDLVAGRENSSVDLEQARKTVELIEDIKSCAIQGVKQ